MRVIEYLRYRAELKGIAMRKSRSAADNALELAGVRDARDRVIGQLSKGYRQRVGIADALVADPPILILDEPTSGLDPNQNRHIRSVIRSFEGTKTVFVSTQILPEVEATCDRVIIIREGEKVSEGRIEDLRAASAGTQLLRLAGPFPFERFREALDRVPTVRRIEREDAHEADLGAAPAARLRLEVEPGDEAVDAVFRAVVDAGLGLRELRRDVVSLEDVYADLTTVEEAIAEPVSQGAARDATDHLDDADDVEESP
jgi:ABC-2 type transport system ATP-binding protein